MNLSGLRRWTWGLVAAGFAIAVGAARALDAHPSVVADAVHGVLWAAVILGVLAYFGARGAPEYRRARGPWFGALVFAVGIGPTLFVMQRAENAREAQKAADILQAMSRKIAAADIEYAKRMEAAMRPSVGAALAADGMATLGTRKQALVDLAAAVRVVDESVSLRERLVQEAIGDIDRTRAPLWLKAKVTGELRAALKAPPPAVRMMSGTRAYLSKADELIVHVDAHDGKFELREGALHFADATAGARYALLRAELDSLARETQRLVEEARIKK